MIKDNRPDEKTVDIEKENLHEELHFELEKIKGEVIKLLSENFYDKALILIEQTMLIVKDDVELYSIKAVILLRQNNYEKAKENLIKGLEIDPYDVDCLYNLAHIYERDDQNIELALNLYNKILHLSKEEELLEEVKGNISQIEKQIKEREIDKYNENNDYASKIPYKGNDVKNILYLGWLGKGNVGDDLLFELFKTMFYKYHKGSVANIDAYPAVQNYKIELSTYDLIVLGGGSLIHLPYWLSICAEGIKHKVPVASWGTGIDGAFKQDNLELIKLSKANIDQFKPIYETFKYISVRGPFTKNMLSNSGVKKEIHEIGDPGLVYFSEILGDQLIIEENRRNILINWGTSYNNIFGRNELAVEEELVVVIRSLILKGYTVSVYPIWTEDIKSVKRLVQKVNDTRCKAINEVYEAKILQKIIAQSYLSINLKLHANILAASANRPFISLAYRGKCFDFAETVNCSEYALATDQVTSEKILNLVEDINNKYDDITERIKTAKKKYYPKIVDSIFAISSIINKQL